MFIRRIPSGLAAVALLALSASTARSQTPVYQDGGRAFRCQCVLQDSSGHRYLSTEFGPYQSKAAFAHDAPSLAPSYPDDVTRCMQVCPKLGPPRTTTSPTTPAGGRTSPGRTTYAGTGSATTIGNAVLGLAGDLASYFDQRAAADAEFSARQQQDLEESRREAADALERERIRREQEFEASKEQTLSLMRGSRPAELQMKGAAPGSLQLKTMNEIAEDERRAELQTFDARMQARIARLRAGASPPAWIAEPADPPPAAPGGATTLPPMIGAGAGQGATAYSVDTGRVVPTSGLPATNVVPAGPPRPIAADGSSVSTDTGKVVNVAPPPAPAGQAGTQGTPTAWNQDTPLTRTGPGPTPATTLFDGNYRATITIQTPSGVVPEYRQKEFMFAVIRGGTVATEVLGSISAKGQLLEGRSQIRLRVGPSATVIVPLNGTFQVNGGFKVTGITGCGSGLCVVTVTGTKVR
jgi:hypothetical protein